MEEIAIRPMTVSDWASIENIYEEDIATGVATFETNVPAYNDWDKAHMSTCFQQVCLW